MRLPEFSKASINTIAGAVNGLGAINGMTVPEWVPGIGGKSVNLPLIPQLASGTKNWKAELHRFMSVGVKSLIFRRQVLGVA